MLLTAFSLLGAIALLLVLIIVHEAGHFFAARHFGMQTPVVGLGLPFFGPTWKVATFKDIEFRFHPVLLGAYVAIPEMDDESAEEDMGIKLTQPKRTFPAWQRMVVSFAGPGANFIFAFLLAILTVVFLGVPDPKLSEEFYVNGVAANASKQVKETLKPGDRLLGVNGKTVKNSLEFRKTLETQPKTAAKIWLQREKANKENAFCKEVVLKTDGAGHLNISLSSGKVAYTQVKGIPVISHLEWAWKYFSGWFMLCLNGLWYLLTAPFRHEANGPKLSEVHGVIFATGMIAKFLGQAASSALQWGALFSIELGIFNLIPILPLDGGHILFQGGEIILGGRKLPQLKQYVAQAGLTLILALTCVILFNDLRDLIFPPH
jgi:regulator of sigma E protease